MTRNESPRAGERGDNTLCTSDDTGTALEVNDVVSFLRNVRPEGQWVLTAIVPDGPICTSTFRADQTDQLSRWLAAYEGNRNLYWQVNSSGDTTLHKKAKKADIERAEWLHVDLDPHEGHDFARQRERILRRLSEFRPEPQVIIDSGGGYQAFWRIAPTTDLDDVEAINRWLANELNGDNCHNICLLYTSPSPRDS